MVKYLVTVKLPRNPQHDPHNKQTGPCPVFGGVCTDITGEHHTGLVETDDSLEVLLDTWKPTYHVTRIEIVS
jgi:hypothetical protein